jgi:sialic acid synthase SpsE
MPDITIAGRRIGPGHAPFIVAECGINDCGSHRLAHELVRAAAESGCDAVKWQHHDPRESDTRQPWMSYATAPQVPGLAMGLGLAYGVTVFAAQLFDPENDKPQGRIGDTRVDFLKIGSGEVSNHQLVAGVARWASSIGAPVLLSTGMHVLSEVDAAVAILREHTVPVAVLECTSTYPARHGEVRLQALAELRDRYPDAVIGISDHAPDIWTALGAVALGASIVEKHFTVSRAWGGPDNPFSIEPAEMAQLCAGARAIHAATSSGLHRVSEAEAETAKWARSGVYATRDIAAGEAFSAANVTVRRPAPPPGGTGGDSWHDYTDASDPITAARSFKAGELIG